MLCSINRNMKFETLNKVRIESVDLDRNVEIICIKPGCVLYYTVL